MTYTSMADMFFKGLLLFALVVLLFFHDGGRK